MYINYFFTTTIATDNQVVLLSESGFVRLLDLAYYDLNFSLCSWLLGKLTLLIADLSFLGSRQSN